MNDANKRTLLDWFKELKINKLLNVNIGGMTSGAGLATEATLTDVKTSVQTLDNAIAGNEMQVDVVGALPAGTNLLGKVGVDQTTLGSTNGVSLVAHATSNGAPLSFRSTTQTNGTGVDVKTSGGNLYGWNIINLHAATIYLKFYNEAAATSASTPVLTLMIPSNSSVYMEPNCIQHNFSTRINIRVVTGSADNDNTAAATLPIIELKYV